MTITLNGKIIDVPEGISVAKLATLKQIPEKGTAVAVNGRHVARDKWSEHKIEPSDNVLIISASYGG